MGEDWDIGGLGYDAYREYAESAVVYRTDPKILPYILKDLTSILAYLDEVALENTTDNRLAMTRVYLYNTLLYFSPNPDPLLMNQIVAIIGESQKLSPTNPNSYWSLAQVRVWQGDFTGAEKAYKDAVALDPYLPASHRLLVQFAKIIGNERLYQESLADAKKYLPEFTEK
jgi:tetratricopeptide (TPR) repeat protein